MLRGTPYVYQGEELGMTNGVFHGLDDFRDVEALRYYREAVAAGEDPESVLAGMRATGRDNGRTPRSVGRGAETRASPTAPRGSASPRTIATSTRPPRLTIRPPCTRTTARSSMHATECRH